MVVSRTLKHTRRVLSFVVHWHVDGGQVTALTHKLDIVFFRNRLHNFLAFAVSQNSWGLLSIFNIVFEFLLLLRRKRCVLFSDWRTVHLFNLSLVGLYWTGQINDNFRLLLHLVVWVLLQYILFCLHNCLLSTHHYLCKFHFLYVSRCLRLVQSLWQSPNRRVVWK